MVRIITLAARLHITPPPVRYVQEKKYLHDQINVDVILVSGMSFDNDTMPYFNA